MIEVLKQMVEALEWCHGGEPIGTAEAIKVGKQAIAELEREKEIHDRHCNQGEWKGVCKYSDSNCPTIAELKSQEPVATVTSETGADITMSWWHEPALPVGTKLFAHPPQRTEQEPVALESFIKWDEDIEPVGEVVGFIEDSNYIMVKVHDEKQISLNDELYIHPPQRKPLTDGDFLDWYDSAIWGNEDFKQCCQIAFEAGWQFAHGIKGEA